MYLTNLADVLRNAGLPVREVAGWKTRGHGAFASVRGVLCHHTAGPATGDYPSEQVVVNGRTGLPGPLANLGLTRGGVWVCIAAGQAWHAGTGAIAWCPTNQGNSHLIGVEAESVGTRDDWTPEQRVSYPRGVAALLAHAQLPASRTIGHKEWAPARKIDPAFWDMNAFRADVNRWLAATVAPSGGFLMALTDAEQRDILEASRSLLFGRAGVRPAGQAATVLADLQQNIAALRSQIANLQHVDATAIAAEVAEAITAAGIAGPVIDELSRRLSP